MASNRLSFKVVANVLALFLLAMASARIAHAADALATIISQDTATYQPLVSNKDVDLCRNQRVLSRIAYNFYHEVRHVPDLPNVRIKSLENITLSRVERAPTRFNITRHFCSANAVLSNGLRAPIWYMIEDGQGFTGLAGMNVEFCLEGFDKWRIQGGSCRAIR